MTHFWGYSSSLFIKLPTNVISLGYITFISWGNFGALQKSLLFSKIDQSVGWILVSHPVLPPIHMGLGYRKLALVASFPYCGLQTITMEGRRMRDITQLKHPLSSKTLWAWVFLWRDNLVGRENLISQCHEKLPWESILTILSAAILVVNKICNQIVKQNVVPKLEHWVRSVMWAGDGVG